MHAHVIQVPAGQKKSANTRSSVHLSKALIYLFLLVRHVQSKLLQLATLAWHPERSILCNLSLEGEVVLDKAGISKLLTVMIVVTQWYLFN